MKVFFLALFCFFGSMMFAATTTWTNGNANNLWSDDGNWTLGAPGASDLARFDGTSTANCTIDVSISVGGIDINAGYSGSIVQASGSSVDIGSSGFDQADGRFLGGDAYIDFNSSTFNLSNGFFQSTSATLFLDDDFTVSGGHFQHNQGTVEFNDNNHQNYNVVDIDTFYNFIMDASSNNKQWVINAADTMVVENKLSCVQGRIMTGTIFVMDSMQITSAYDEGTANVRFRGSSNGHMIVDSDKGLHNCYVEKDADTDTLFISGNSNSPQWGTSVSLFINQGTVDFSGNTSLDLNFDEIEINAGYFLASSGTTSYQGTWDNNGGKFVHNNGVWEWDFSDHRSYMSTVIDTFYTVLCNQNNNKYIDASTADTMLVLNKIELNNGRLNNIWIKVVDTVEFNSGFDDLNGFIEFVGSGSGNLISNSTNGGNIDVYVTKTETDTVFILDEDGGSVNVGTTDAKFTLNSGIVSFVNTEANIDYEELELNGGVFVAPSDIAYVQGDWDNNGGKFLHNNGIWEWDFTDHRDYRTTEIDTFYSMHCDQSANKYIYMSGEETFVVLQTLDLVDGRIDAGQCHVIDSLILRSNVDNGTPNFYFVGSGTTHFISDNSSSTNIDYYVSKASSADSVIITDFDGGTVTVGSSNYDCTMFINTGVVGWSSDVSTAELDLDELELNAGGTLVGNNGTLRFNAIWDNNGGEYIHNSQTFHYDVANHRDWSSSVTDVFYDFLMNPTSGDRQMYMYAGDTIRVENDLTLQNGRINTGVVAVEGNVSVNSDYDDPTTEPTLVFSGANPQTFDATGAESDWNGHVIIDKSDDTLTLLSDFEINSSGQSVTFVDGFVLSTTSTLFHFTDNNGSISGGSASSFNQGPMQKTNNGSITMPLGDAGVFGSVRLKNTTGTGTSFRCEYHRTDPTNDGFDKDSRESGVEGVSSVEYWNVERVASSNVSTVQLNWEITSGVQAPSDLIVAHWDETDGRWENAGGNDISGDVNSGSVSSNSFSDFSPFALGTSSSGNVLPIVLIGFDAYARGTEVVIEWSTAVEIDCDYYEIQRSSNGRDFQTIMTVSGAGNSDHRIDYLELDRNPLQGKSFYRLKQVDFDGTFWISNASVVEFQGELSELEVLIYPNPAERGSNVRFQSKQFDKSDLLICLTGIDGKNYYCKMHKEGDQTAVIDLSESIPAGNYIITASSAKGLVSKRLVIR